MSGEDMGFFETITIKKDYTMYAEKINENQGAQVINMPKKENIGSSFIENEFFEAVAKHRIPGEQMQILSAIIRKTWCWKKDSDLIAKSQIASATGIVKSHLDRAIKALSERNIIKVTKKGNNTAQEFEINKNYSEWTGLPKKVRLPNLVKIVTKEGNFGLPNLGPSKGIIKNKKENTPLPPKIGGGEVLSFKPEIPTAEIAKIYNETLPNHTPVKLDASGKINAALIEKKIKAFWNSKAEFRDLDYYRAYFGSIKTFPALCGEKEGFDWMPDITWLLGPINHGKVTADVYKATNKTSCGFNNSRAEEPSGALPEWKEEY